MYSLIVPVYKNEECLPELLEVLGRLDEDLAGNLTVLFVVDGSPDRSLGILKERLPGCSFRSGLLALSRNFGSFAAIRAGLAAAPGPYYAVMAADLQEPPELMKTFFEILERDGADVVLGSRRGRGDPLSTRLLARSFWWFYRRFVQPEIPAGGVDVFGCNQRFRDDILHLQESNTSLVGLICWLGFRREIVPYCRQQRRHGKSAWSFRRRAKYLLDSIFAFTDLPIRLLGLLGLAGLLISIGFGAVVLAARLLQVIEVPGYAATAILILFFGSLNLVCLGIIGSYVWRAFENTKRRPEFIVREQLEFEGLR